MTKREGAILSAHTGLLLGDFASLQKYADEKFGYPTYTHQFGNEEFVERLKELSKQDFISIMETQD